MSNVTITVPFAIESDIVVLSASQVMIIMNDDDDNLW